ncbi:MAG: hypothetical protein JSS76_08360 [Bacteroidetes bacterium]|nr:hypothetical protein [Bacteroidota bacterium]
MAKKEALKVPTKTFTSGGATYQFRIAKFYHNGVPYTAEEALDNEDLLDELVEASKKDAKKPHVADGLLKLVETAESTSTAAKKPAPANEVISAIKNATTAEEIDALAAGDTRKTVVDAAVAAKEALTK